MSDEPNSRGHVPIDLVCVAALTLLTAGAVLVPTIRGTTIANALSAVFVSFVPGYVLLRAVAYRRASQRRAEPLSFATARSGGWTTLIEWTVLSIGASLAITAGLGFVLTTAPVDVRSHWIIVLLCLLTLPAIGAALRFHRRAAGDGTRATTTARLWPGEGRLRDAFRPRSRTDLAVTVVLISVLAAITVGAVYMVAFPGDGTNYTTLAVLNDDGDQLTAANYPDELSEGEPASLVLEIHNREGEATAYTVVTQLQRIEDGSVANTTEADRFELDVGAGETVRYEHEVTAETTGDVRLVYLLYVGDPPSDPTTDNAYRSVHLSFTADGG